MTIKSRVYSFGEEFTDFVLIDKQRQSIILNIKKCYFRAIYKEYKRLGYTLAHVTHFNEDRGMTCVFVKGLQDK